jgi:hypothetical protein
MNSTYRPEMPANAAAINRSFLFMLRYPECFFRAVFFFGIRAPDFRASERPIAIACLRLLTTLPDRPLRNSPRFISCIARLTFRFAVFRFAAMTFPVELDGRSIQGFVERLTQPHRSFAIPFFSPTAVHPAPGDPFLPFSLRQTCRLPVPPL